MSWADGGNAMPVPIAPSTGENMDSISHANTLTREEAIQAFEDLMKGKGMPNGSDYAELWMRAPEQIGQLLPGPISAGMALLAATDVTLTGTDKANLVYLLNQAAGDYLSGSNNIESMTALNTALNRLGVGSTNSHFQGYIKDKVETNVNNNQKGNESSNFQQHVAKEEQLAENWNNTNQAHDANNYNKYKDDAISQMEKPIVKDQRLQGLFDDLYRENAKIGSGSTADAVRHELATGEKVGGKTHTEKAQTYSVALKNWLDKNPTASAGDRAAAENVLKDMQNALNGK